MYAIYGNIYHQYTPNVSIYTLHGSYGLPEGTTTNPCFFFGRGIALFHDLIGGRLQSEATLPCLPGPGTRGMGALMKR